jgi:hypothetical protein
MTDDYVRLKVREALNATDGDRHDAQKLLITWAVRDPALLLGVAKPHLKAIAAGLIEHAARSKDDDKVALDDGPDNLSRTAIDDIVAQTAKNPFDKRRKPTVPPPKSTERQASTMRKLAAAFTKKRK